MNENRDLPKVLIVDDMPANISMLVGALGGMYELRAATSGKDALEAVHEEPPDLILLDVNMPGLSGADVCRTLKENADTAGIPIIFVTGRDDEEDELLGLELGAADYVTRPFSVPILKARIQTHLKMKRYQTLLERLSFQDGLTGLPNRRRFDEFLALHGTLSSRTLTPLGVIVMDIDHFKIFNDTFGHPEGDECLQKVGQVLVSVIKRSTDLLARYGGEEFVCVLPNTPVHGALVVAENLRNAVIGLKIPHSPRSGGDYVTISLGVSSRQPVPGENPRNIFLEADQALYQAKRQGRNCSVVFQSEK